MSTTASFWDERFQPNAGFAYGRAPNDFLVEAARRLKPNSKILSLAEGEGRNAIYLAQQGHSVHCVDFSRVGLAKTDEWAQQLGLSSLITTEFGDLAIYNLGEGEWDAIVSIWCHLPADIRKRVHHDAERALKPQGVVILEAYTPNNIGRGTGGPREPEMCMDTATLRGDFAGLSIEYLEEKEREIVEGGYHSGLSATVQLIARRIQ
ncbi:SAM domain-containing protein [Polychytrium aggregatum]|uniref:SAM domain-containing protein n=1 Tax=Polychytrium aggregatum TaxID=110093 RepID=UPI0022FE11A3|nr:SAM domain-containing protein [Polychytrium aggregatum]KAI9202011.1 SAM domain-containing protein [Polychytrium aggregatum]